MKASPFRRRTSRWEGLNEMRRRKTGSLERKKGLYGYLFTAPFIVGSLLGVVYPIVLSLVYSFGNLVPQDVGYRIDFVGFKNYSDLFTVDPDFLRQLVETLQRTLLKVPVAIVFSFFLACVLNSEFPGRGFARTILFMPLILFSKPVEILLSKDTLSSQMASKSADASVMISERFVSALEEAGIGEGLMNFLTASVDNIGNLLYISVIPTIIILAGLQSVSRSLYEASYVEGATAWEVLWKISLPMISPLLLVSVIYCVIDSFTGVENVIINRVSYECFTAFRFGSGSAVAWSYIVVVLAIVGIVFAIANRFVSYDN